MCIFPFSRLQLGQVTSHGGPWGWDDKRAEGWIPEWYTAITSLLEGLTRKKLPMVLHIRITWSALKKKNYLDPSSVSDGIGLVGSLVTGYFQSSPAKVEDHWFVALLTWVCVTRT